MDGSAHSIIVVNGNKEENILTRIAVLL